MNANGSSAIFVTGPARSGTELVRGMLNRHHDIHLAAETHYFDDLRPRLGAQAIAGLDGEDRIRAIDYFRALRHRAYGLAGNPEDGDWSRDLLDEAALPLGSGGDAIFAAYCRLSADEARKGIWGEKTPRHVFRVNEILAAFPNAHIVVVLRDVRGVVASYRDWQNHWFDRQTLSAEMLEAVSAAKSYSLTLNALLWCSAVRTAVGLERRYGPGRITLLRFDDVLNDPSGTAQLLCDRIGVAFDKAMLDAGVVNSSYIGSHTSQGFDVTVAERWRERLSLAERRHLDLIAGRTLAQLGYIRDRLGISIRHSGWEFVKTGFAVLQALFSNRARIAQPIEYIRVRATGLWN